MSKYNEQPFDREGIKQKIVDIFPNYIYNNHQQNPTRLSTMRTTLGLFFLLN